MAKLIHENFQKNQIKYWSTGGTTLGLVRHKAVIPWDDDIDICMMDDDEEKLNRMKDQLKS